MGKAVGYVRVSTAGQTEGVSLDAQQAKIKKWAECHDYQLDTIHCDAGISGTKQFRPGLEAALNDLKKNDVLVVYSLSRLSRSTQHALELLEMLRKKSVGLVSLTEDINTTTAAGKMMVRMLLVLLEFERDLISERTSEAMQHKKWKGEKTGGDVPYGQRLDTDGVHLVNDPDEQAVIEEAKRLQGEGLSLRKIALRLEEMGHLTRTGKRFQAVQIQRLLM